MPLELSFARRSRRTSIVEELKKSGRALSAGGAVFLSLANPVNLLFVVLLFVAGFALLTERIVLVGFISTLALLMAALGASLLAAFLLRFEKTLSPRGFSIFLAITFVTTLFTWSFEIFNDIADFQWFYVALLAAVLLTCSLVLVPRLQNEYLARGILRT